MSSHCSAPAAFEHMGSCRPPAKAQLEAADAVLRRVAAPPVVRLGQPAPVLPGRAAVRQARHDGSSAHAAALRWQHPQHRSPPQPHVQATSDVCLAAPQADAAVRRALHSPRGTTWRTSPLQLEQLRQRTLATAAANEQHTASDKGPAGCSRRHPQRQPTGQNEFLRAWHRRPAASLP